MVRVIGLRDGVFCMGGGGFCMVFYYIRCKNAGQILMRGRDVCLNLFLNARQIGVLNAIDMYA